MTQTRDAGGRLHLEQIRIASPCEVPWDSMRGDDRVRFCRSCRQNVYNVEAMTRAEAERLIGAREGRVCVRMLWRPDGTVVTADCWTRLRAARRRGVIPFLAMLVVVGWAELVAMRFGLRPWQPRTMGAPPPAPPPATTPVGEATPPPPPPQPLVRLAGKPAIPVHKMGEPRFMGRMLPRNTTP
jgi:hypothetical protein